MFRLVGDNGAIGKTVTVEEYLEKAKDKHSNTVYYTNDISQQTQAIELLRAEGIEVAVFDLVLDAQYLTALEHYMENVRFIRVDSGIADSIKAEFPDDNNESREALEELFKKVSGNNELSVHCEQLKNEEIPAILSVSEESRRMEDMLKLYALGGNQVDAFPLAYTLTLNTSSRIYAKLTELHTSGSDRLELFASYVYRLALMAHRKPTAEELTSFLSDSYKILELI